MDKPGIEEIKRKISIENITENIRNARDTAIFKLLSDSNLMDFLETHYNTIAISAVKTEFLKRDLKQLLSEPLDLAFYSSLITQLKNSGTNIPSPNHPLFLAELFPLFSKYGFTKE